MKSKAIEPNKKITASPFIVGIGASAGGMEAIHDLFDYMPDNTGFCFVVIQHLSPDYKSLMAELLSRHTSMNVVEAEEGMVVKPNCIYVIPSKKLITIHEGKLRLDEKIKNKLPNNAIDIFFESLAEDAGKSAIAIILSGTGSDGTKGIEAIKANGGTVVVQDPLTAAFDGMPNSAIASGQVDLILPPEVMGEEIAEFVREAPLMKSLSKLSQKDELLLREILGMLNQTVKLDFSLYKRPTLFRRLAKRMSEAGIERLEEYKTYLSENEDELKALGKEFLINVTKFFRDKEAFESLRTEVIPTILNGKKSEDPVKAWVVACSSGEEAYSIAILFLEQMKRTEIYYPNLKIFATDIDTDALETASRGIYGLTIEKDVPPHLLQKYFIREANLYRVSAELRKHVVFANHDILKDPPFSHLDLLTCRNMFIYVNSTLQKKMLKKFHFALDLNGYLMLGPSENIGVLKDVMKEVNRKWKLFQCISKSGISDQDNLFSSLDTRFYSISNKPLNPQKNLQGHLSEIFKDTLLEEKKIASFLIDREFNVKHAIGNYKNFIKLPEDNLHFNLIRLVSSDLAIALGICVRKSIADNERAVMKRVLVHDANQDKYITIIVKPYLQQTEFQQPFLSVIFEEDPLEIKVTRAVEYDSITSKERVEDLERELNDTRENLQAVIEEMETTNEELQSTNEEMISTNEELQSTNEELQSLNEELHTVSGEHQIKIKELLELNDDLNNYFNNSDIGQILVDKRLVTRKFSPAVTRMVNLIESDIGRSILDISTNFKDINLAEDIRKVIQTSEPFEREIPMPGDRYYLMRIVPYVKRDKTQEGAVINFIDITEAKKLNSLLKSIFASSPNGITAKKAIRNTEDKIIDFEYLVVNPTAEKFLRKEHGSLEGKRLLAAFPEMKIEGYFDKYVEVVETGIIARFERYDPIDDTWFEVTAVKMLDGVVTTHTDITERKKAINIIAQNYEELKTTSDQLERTNVKLERSNYDLLQFASVASHDLKEPLRKIQAFGNILQEKVKEKLLPDEQNYFHKMISASGRMQTLIEDVLTLSKLSNNGVSKEKVDPHYIIRRICDDLEIAILEKHAKVEVQGTLPMIRAVPGQMRQLFQNLISNSLKFSNNRGETPTILITEKKIPFDIIQEFSINPAEFICISVQDNGIGFENEYREKIFGVFQRLNGRNYEGTGIGLAIARKIVENHAGYISARGELDRCAEFFILLPKA
jgi:two-component system CheB/CheR fusion protein